MAKFYTTTGFSIELFDYRLERRGEHEGLPLYEALDGKVTAIAIVEKPAIKKGVLADPDTKIIVGPVMIPDQKIFRPRGPNGAERCYWYFSVETIKRLQQTFKGNIKFGH
jgi:hypothetical protein